MLQDASGKEIKNKASVPHIGPVHSNSEGLLVELGRVLISTCKRTEHLIKLSQDPTALDLGTSLCVLAQKLLRSTAALGVTDCQSGCCGPCW